MIYKVRWEMTAFRAWRKLDAKAALMILNSVTDLTADPRPAASTELVGGDGLRRLKAGDYRVIYEISKDDRLVTIWEVGHRREIYR
ncbi:type II toxin-antitoxin system RelE family toxin [Allorhizocola rhizosphaerae]|uniref:type II toxin-antitoxin system RelE family toxin n=1 Tax=Allorhizocola rhizosphaerae TaxID=1872709 RepID=UPI000E3C6C95|nr:type II toxin-antitoxin system RelE/ParE family toxin [Allorhizocola rhizosphaerae]